MNRSITLLVSLLACLSASAQFRYLPERPKIDGSVSFTYTPTGTLASEAAIQALVLRYGSPSEMRSSQPETVPVTKAGEAVVGTIKVPFKEVAGLLVVFQSVDNPKLIDHNDGHFYPVPLYNKAGKLLPHAIGGQASVVMRTSFPYLLKIKPDWTWAVQQYEQEIAQYPATRPVYWADLIRAKMQQAAGSPTTRPDFLAEIDAYLTAQQPTPTPADLTAAAQLYELLKEPKLAQEARSRIKAVDPNRPEAQKERADAIQAEPDVNKKRAAFDAFVMATPKSPYREQVVSALADAYVKAGRLNDVVQFLGAEAAPATDPALLLSFARQLTGEGRGLPQAEWLARRAVWAFQKRPLLASPAAATDRANQIRTAQATLASAVDQQGRFRSALANYRDAATGLLPKQTDPRTNERTWFCAVQATRADSVWPFIEQVVLAGRTTARLRSDLRTWLTPRLAEGTAQKTAFQRSFQRGLALLDRADRRAALAGTFIDELAPAFSLKTLDGKSVSLAGLRGKVAVLNLWATSCEPCLASLSTMRQARDQVKNDPRVQFLFVNTRDTSPASQVRSFVRKLPPVGVVPLDPNQALAVAYGIERVPATVIIDAQGRIRYRSPGNATTTADEIALMIEALKD